MYKLRHYQQEAVDAALDFFRGSSKHRPILVLPTGSGKSLIIAFIVKQLEGRVLILQPNVELLEQNYAKYDTLVQADPTLEKAAIYSASAGMKDDTGRVTFATIGSICKIPESFQDVKYVLIDECHLVPPNTGSMYMQFLSQLNAQTVGLTATPYRLKTYNGEEGKYSQINLLPRERPLFFNKFLYVVHTKQMYDEGFLCPVKYISMKWDGSFLQFNSTGAEYSDNSVKEALERNQILTKIPNILAQAYAKGRRSCIVFVSTVAEAKMLAEITPFSTYIHAETKKSERREMIKAFKNGSIKTIFNVAVLTTGFDYPELDTVIIARPTASLALFVQMIGRGIRLAEGKDHCTVLDMCGNLQRFGKIEELRVVLDEWAGWVLRNDRQILSGRPLNELVK